jgi:SAM-dependent methyltransferase
VSLRAADAQNLPFENGAFEVAVCRLALHHLQKPFEVLRQMVGVCRASGTVLTEDIYASEHSERAAYQDRPEILRDPSHVRTLPVSELLQLFRDAGLETDAVTTADNLTPESERWLATTKTLPERAVEIRGLPREDQPHDWSGTRPFQDATGRLYFHARIAIFTGRKVS